MPRGESEIGGRDTRRYFLKRTPDISRKLADAYYASRKARGAGYKHGGWKEKYIISKTSGKPVDPKAKYFVLRYDQDPHARVALAAYAESVQRDNPLLADDVRKRLRRFH